MIILIFFANFVDQTWNLDARILVLKLKTVFDDLLNRLWAWDGPLNHLHYLRVLIPLWVIDKVCIELKKIGLALLNKSIFFVCGLRTFVDSVELLREDVELQASLVVKVKLACFLSNEKYSLVQLIQ